MRRREAPGHAEPRAKCRESDRVRADPLFSDRLPKSRSPHNEITTEARPYSRDESLGFEHHLDSLHHNRAIGDLILDVVLDYSVPDRHRSDGFGVRLTRDNIDAHLLRTRLDEER